MFLPSNKTLLCIYPIVGLEESEAALEILRNFAKFTRKHLRQSLFFNKVADRRSATLLKWRLWYRCFPVNFPKFLRAPSLTEHVWATASKDLKYCLHYAHLLT